MANLACLQKMRQELLPYMPLDLVLVAHDYLGRDILLDDSRIECVIASKSKRFTNSLFQQTNFDDCSFHKVVFCHVVFVQTSFSCAKFNNCYFENCTFWHIDWPNAELFCCTLVNCAFENTDMQENAWDNCFVNNSSFLKCNFNLVRFRDCSCYHLQLEDCNLCNISKTACRFRRWEVKNCQLPDFLVTSSLSGLTYVFLFAMLILMVSLVYLSAITNRFRALPAWCVTMLPWIVIAVVSIICCTTLRCHFIKHICVNMNF
jgi:hypothetical protein